MNRFVRVVLPGAMVLALSIQFTAAAGGARAQANAGVNLSAQLGFDGYCKEGEWLPIRVELENTGENLNATVRVSYENSGDGETSTSMNVTLPAGSRKEFFLYLHPQGFVREINVNLLEGKRVLEKFALPAICIASENMLFGVISENPSVFDVLAEVKPLTGITRVAHLEISDLPEKPQAWSSLDALVVSNADTGALTAEQKVALEAWLAAGGKLFVTGGFEWQGTVAGLTDFLPVEINRTRRVFDLLDLQAFSASQSLPGTEAVVSVGAMRTGAEVLVEQEGIPILIQRRLGFGVVYFLAADPALQPLSDWDGMKDLYAHLFGSRTPAPLWFRGENWDGYTANQALGAISELGLPSIFYITCLLGIYVLIIGPINYLVLRRLKRRELAWATIPALVILFSCLSYGTGLIFRGTTPILNRLVFAQAWDGIDQAHVRALVGIYSPVRASYDLEAGAHFLPSPHIGETGNVQSNNNWALEQDGANMILPDVRVEIGAMKAVSVDGAIPALPISHDLVLKIGKSNPTLAGKIVNQSSYTLKDAVLITPDAWQRLGNLGPGASKSLSASLAVNSSGQDIYSFDPFTLMNLDYQDRQTDVDQARRYAFLQTVLSSDYQRYYGNWGIFLLGWVDQPVLPVELRDKNSDTVDTMLYALSLSPTVKTESGELNIPVSLMVWESNNPVASPYYTPNVPAAGYELRFKPAFPLRFRAVRSLHLFLDSNAAPGDLIASAWDFEGQAWVPVSMDGSSVDIPNADRYVSPGGEVRIKVVNTTSDWTEVWGSYITLVVAP